MNKYVYVSFIKTNTPFGRLVRKVTGWKYSHVNICLDSKLHRFYAFGRASYKSNLLANFNVDYKSNYTLLKDIPVDITYYKIPVTKDEYDKIKDFIDDIQEDGEYIFNFLSMITTTILHGFEIYKSYNCITFISKIFSFISSIKLSKKYYKYDLNELEDEVKSFYYKQETYYYKMIEDNNKYFDDIPYFKVKKVGFLYLRENFYRLIRKKTSKRYKKYVESIKSNNYVGDKNE